MKQKQWMMRLVALALCLMAVAVCMTACDEEDDVIVVEPANDATVATVPTKAPSSMGRIEFSYLLAVQGPDLLWKELAPFEHTVTEEGKATFIVDCDGREATLYMEYDVTSGKVSVADLTYKDATVSILTDDYTVLRTVAEALAKDGPVETTATTAATAETTTTVADAA